MAHPLWPLFDLRIRTERLEFRLPTDDDLAALAALARAGIHDAAEMPFSVPWSTKESPRFEREFAQYHWGARASWRPADWMLDLMAVHGDRPIGMQGIFAREFGTFRAVRTGSWLGRDHQGRGLGKEMRAAVLALAFDGLGAQVAETEAFADNAASAGVSRSLGYEPNGIGRLAPLGETRDTLRFRMTREMWRSRERPPVMIEGLEGCLGLFGVAAG